VAVGVGLPCGVGIVYVTVIVSVAVFPALSHAVTVMALVPLASPILATFHVSVPLAVP
jgi:hypothetical protein